VYLTGVRVSDSAVIGMPGDGWRVAMTTLMNERSSLGSSVPPGERTIDRAIGAFRRADANGTARRGDLDRLVQCYIQSEVARLTSERLARSGSAEPGPEGSLAKLAMARANQAIFELCLSLIGAEGMLIDDYVETRPDVASVHGSADVRKAFLRTRANSIEGGTSEVLRTVAAERVLGLPPEPRADKNVPWADVRRS
jgi:alkylation response protein AidB-like acyl-CoA dehydrogenase